MDKLYILAYTWTDYEIEIYCTLYIVCIEIIIIINLNQQIIITIKIETSAINIDIIDGFIYNINKYQY